MGTINCPAGSLYNSTDALCLCPSGTAFNSNGVCAPVIITPPPPQNANSVTIITLPKNVTYTTNVLVINASTINSPTTGAVHNISVSIGVSIPTLSNSIYNISHGVNSTSLIFGCLSCAQASGAIAANNATESFEFNTPVANSIINSAFIRKVIAGNVISANSAFNIALLMKQNSSLLKQFVSNYTPSGYRPVFNATINQQNSTLVYKAQWLAVSNTASSYVNLSVIKSFSNNTIAQSSIPIAQRAVVPYIAEVFNRTNIANRTTSQQLYVTDVLSGNQTTARYVPTNVTTYKTTNAVVIGVTDVVTNYNDYINIPKSPVPISNMSISVKRNFTVGAISIQTYAASSPSAISKAVPALPGKTASYIYVNSTINDTNINSVNYTFNVTKA